MDRFLGEGYWWFCQGRGEFFSEGQLLLTETVQTSDDLDNDKIADKWEREQVDEFNAFFGYSSIQIPDEDALSYITPNGRS